MIDRLKKYLPALLFAGGFVVVSCSEPDPIGVEVLPGSDQPGVFFTDTVTLEANTIREDSLRSDEFVAAFNLVGSYTDPVFGLSRASFYSQVRLPGNNTNFTFGTNPVLDSVVLTLAYADYYGDTLTPMQVEVYETTESMYFDTTYFTNNQVAFGTMLFSGMVAVHPKDSVLVNGAKLAPHLRLRLDDAFGNGFLSAATSNFTDNNAFISFFKGIHVKTTDVTTSGQGVIMSFNLLSTLSKLTFYYTNAASTSQQAAYFEINSGCPRFNHYEHDYTASEFGSNFPIPGDNRLYVQSMSGLKVRLKFPYLKNFSSAGPVSVNKAELEIPATDFAQFGNHQNLLVFGVDSAGKEAVIPDLLEPLSYYGGSFSASDNTYKFNISHYVQQLLSGRIANDYGLSLISSGGAINAFRTVIPGISSGGTRVKLNITYSKLQ